MNMRVNPGGAMSDMAGKLTMPSMLKGGAQGGGCNALSQNAPGNASGKSGMLQYGGAEGGISERSSKGGISSDYQSLMKSLIDQGRAEMAKLKEQLAQEMSAGSQQSGTPNASGNTTGNGTQNVMSQLQMLLDSITKLIKQSQENQNASGSSHASSSDAKLGDLLSQLNTLLSSLGEASGTGAATGEATSAGPAMPKDEKDTSVPPSSDTLFKSMDGDNRSADQIINDNPVLKNLGNQKDIKQEELKKQFGDWTSNNPDEKSRALAAKNMSYFLNNVKALDNREGGDRGDISTNGKIEGITKHGDARHGTEAAIVKDVAEQGLDKMFPKDGRLTSTSDEMVNLNGTNKSGFQGICLKLGKALAFIPGLSNVLTGMGRSESTNPWDVIKGGIVGGVKTAFDALKGVAEGLMTGRMSPVQMLMSAYKGAVMDTYAMQDVKSDAKDKAKEMV